MTPVGWEGLGISNATMAAFFLPGAGVNMYLPVYVERVGGVAGSVQCGRACSVRVYCEGVSRACISWSASFSERIVTAGIFAVEGSAVRAQ